MLFLFFAIASDLTLDHRGLYSSLVASLLVSFIAVLSKQQLDCCAQVGVRGFVINHSRHQQPHKIHGMITWHFDLVIVPPSENDIAQECCHLFHVVIQTPVSPTCSQEKKWEVRLTMRRACKWDTFLPWVKEPQDIFTFLDHHFDLSTRGVEIKASQLRTLCMCWLTLRSAKSLKRFGPTEPSFVCSIRMASRSGFARSLPPYLLPAIDGSTLPIQSWSLIK